MTKTNKNNENNPKSNSLEIQEGVCWRSDDGLVEILIKTQSAKRWPQHAKPVVCMHLHPRPYTRVQKLAGQGDSIDVLFTFVELRQLLDTIALVDDKFQCKVYDRHQPKPAWRKEYWRAKNMSMFSNPGSGGSTKPVS